MTDMAKKIQDLFHEKNSTEKIINDLEKQFLEDIQSGRYNTYTLASKYVLDNQKEIEKYNGVVEEILDLK